MNIVYLISSYIFNVILFFISLDKLFEMVAQDFEKNENVILFSVLIIISTVSILRILNVYNLMIDTKKSNNDLLDNLENTNVISKFNRRMVLSNLALGILMLLYSSFVTYKIVYFEINGLRAPGFEWFEVFISVSLFYSILKTYFYYKFYLKIN